MKTIYLIPVLLLAFLYTSAQKRDDNTILVSGVQYEDCAKKLLAAGWLIEKRDAELMTLKTEPRRITSFWDLDLTIILRVENNVAYVSGLVRWGTILNKEPVIYPTTKSGKPRPKTIFGISWTEMEKAALLLGSSLSYEKR